MAETALHHLGKRPLTGVAERRVSEVVRQRDRFGKVFVQIQRPRDAARDLRNFQRVGETGRKVVAARR